MITVSGLTKAYGARVLFRDVTFQLSPGRRIALVGGNGAGKTTLMEIILGLNEADSGEVHRPKDLTSGYLPQEIVEWGSGSVLDEVLAGKPEIRDLEHRIARLHDEIGATSGLAHDRALAAYGDAQSRFESLGGYAVEAEAHRVLAGLGFAPADADRPLTDMSGGWRMRAALGRLLLARPEVLLLDEPTNHLDTDSVTWLEDTLSSYPGAILFVSHDRDFIDAVAERVIELAGGGGDGVRRGLRRVRGGPGGAAGAGPGRRGPPAAGGRPRRAVHRPVPLQGHEGPSGPEQDQDAREARPHRGARPPRQGGPVRLPATPPVLPPGRRARRRHGRVRRDACPARGELRHRAGREGGAGRSERRGEDHLAAPADGRPVPDERPAGPRDERRPLVLRAAPGRGARPRAHRTPGAPDGRRPPAQGPEPPHGARVLRPLGRGRGPQGARALRR